MSADKARNMRNTVRALQHTLFRAAKQSLDRKFGALYDKVYREDVVRMAWKQVRANNGAPGVDRQSFEHIEEQIGVEAFLAELTEELREQRYRPQAVRRCWIEKPGKPEKRPLGIPVIRDRVVQAAVKIVIEPIFEANFLPGSYGFRPKRSAHMAISQAQKAITFGRQTVVIDADIKGCYDNIRHDLLLNLVQRRISDQRILKLIKGWLKAGVMDAGVAVPSGEVGTPQGGVISPLLANIYLHSFDRMFQIAKIPGMLVRYADDLVILLWRDGAQVLEKVRAMMGRLGLVLHPEKTRVVQAAEGFDFLGVHFRLRPVLKPKAKVKFSCRVWPSERSVQRIKQRVREVIDRRYGMALKEMIQEINPVLRGWNTYQTTVQPERKRFEKLNSFVRERFRIFLKRKHNDQSRGAWRVHGNVLVRLGLFQLG